MGRYSREWTEKGKQLENWIQKLANEVNTSLKNAELVPEEDTQNKVRLNIIRNPFEPRGKKYLNGFVGTRIKFDKNEPDFLTEEDKVLWYSKVRELARERFGIGTLVTESEYISFFSINLEEDSEDKLYALTPNKEEFIKKGFERLRNYVDFYTSAVREYDNVIKDLSYLEALSK